MPYQQHEAWDYIPLSLSMQKIMNPFSVIEEFFNEEIDIVDARKELKLWWRSAFSEKCLLSKREIVSLVGFRDLLLPLVEAAGLLPLQVAEGISIAEEEMLNPANFCDSLQEGYTTWDYFPRHLGKKEFANPHKVLRKFFAHKNLPEWRDILEELFSAAISDCSIYSCTDEKDILLTCEFIAKLMEAAYLLKVRKTGK